MQLFIKNILSEGKEYLLEIRRGKMRLVLAAVVSVILFTLSCIYLFEGFGKRFLLYTVLSLLTGVFLVIPRLKRWYLTVPLVLLYLLYVPQKIFQRIEIPLQDMSGLLKGAKAVNILIILLIYAVFLLLLQRVCYAFLGGNIFLLIGMLLNYYSSSLSGNGLAWYDLKNPSFLLSVFTEGKRMMTGELWYSILYFLFFMAFGFWCDLSVKREKRYHFAVTAFSLVFCLFFTCFWNFSGYTEAHGLQGYHGGTRYDEELDGFLLGFSLGIKELREDGEWYEKHPIVCHALGASKEGDAEGNYLEGLEYNYNLGHRVFEVDIQITSDQVAVLRHDWDQDLGQTETFGWTEENRPIPTAEKFLEAPILGKYTPMLLLDLYEIMAEREDMYIVLDPKYSPDVTGQFEVIVNTALDNGYESVLDRVIVQLYYEDMYEQVAKIYPFKNYIYTLYYTGWGGESVGRFCEEKEIPVLVLPYVWLNDEIVQQLEEYPWLKVYPHTINDLGEAQHALSLVADGIYSATITPSQIIRWRYGEEGKKTVQGGS